ncbi:hypothetical protein CRE_16570 [Caenorhabditis remanei]|uniref:Uncharacterized protein n=1 Tax=Caenorhabditis remanei TaxID=31234 RepID=E3NTW5_CAERE|nr:hypothetical protein CRE_16570 [Caenorhabditis remanei]
MKIYHSPRVGVSGRIDFTFFSVFLNGAYWSIVFRAHGIVLLTIHRYLVIVKPLSGLTHFIQNEKMLFILVRFWIPPFIFNVILFSDNRIQFHFANILTFAMDTSIVNVSNNEIISDLLSLTFYTVLKLSTSLFPEYFFFQEAIPFAQIFLNGVYWSIVFRAHGIALLTIHRYLVIVKPSSVLTHFIQREKQLLICIRFWIPPIIFNCFFFLEWKIRYKLDGFLIFVMDTSIVDRYSKLIIVFLGISCLLCLFSYLSIIVFVRSKVQTMSQSIKRELRLALQMSLPFAGLLALLLYMTFYATHRN